MSACAMTFNEPMLELSTVGRKRASHTEPMRAVQQCVAVCSFFFPVLRLGSAVASVEGLYDLKSYFKARSRQIEWFHHCIARDADGRNYVWQSLNKM